MRTMARKYSDESSDENKNHRRRRQTTKPDSDSDRETRYSRGRDRYQKDRYNLSGSDNEKDTNERYNSRKDDSDRYVSGRDRERKEKEILSDFDEEKSNREKDRYGREKGRVEISDLDRNKTNREKDSNSNRRDGKESVVEKEKGEIDSSDESNRERYGNVKERKDKVLSDVREGKRKEKEILSDFDEEKPNREKDRYRREKGRVEISDLERNKKNRERIESVVEREKGEIDSSDESDRERYGNVKGKNDKVLSDVREGKRKENERVERGKNDLSDLDEKKVSRDGRVREKRVDDSSDSDKEKVHRKRNGGGRDRKGRDDDSSDSERDGRGRKRRDGDRDRKRDRDRKDRREKSKNEDDDRDMGEGDRERRYLDRDRRERGREDKRETRYERDERREKEQNNGFKQDSNPQKVDVVASMANIGRTGGVYIPPFKLARMMKEVEDKSSVEYQRLTWDALRKSINGLVNKVNATNIKNIVPELFSENLVRGRGLFCRSCMKSQMASPGFTDVFAALVAVVNTKFPQIGYLLLKRIVLQLKRAYKRNDKPQLLAAVKFIAHLVNQQVVHELLALELLTLLLDKPTDDSVEVAVGFVTECGSLLQDLSPRGLHGIFESFRGILHEGEIDKRVQFLIEGLFAIRKAKFQGHPAVRPELDLVELEDQLTHEISLADDTEDQDPETMLDVFKPDPDFLKNEKIYEDHKKNILGDESEDKSDSDAGSDDEDDEESEEDEEEEEERMKIQDETETNLVNLRRTIYLTIMSSVDFEEAGHKLLKIKLEPGQEMELCIMLLECCSQERTYLRYYGLLGQRFCMINKVHQENFEKSFVQQYSMIHRLETNKLRNVAKFFAHLLGTDALPWHVLAYIRLTEEDTTSSSRIFIKILFQELSEHLGIRLLNERLNDPTMQDSFESIFPKDNPKNTRFSINFFTSIGLGGITENLREYLKNMPRLIMQQQKPASESDDESGDSSSSSGSDASSSESDSSSSSESESDRKRRERKRRRRS